MFAPKLYEVYKFSFRDVLCNDFNMSGNLDKFKIKQQDNMMFRQIRKITGNYGDFIPNVVFMSCEGVKAKLEDFQRLLEDGLVINGKLYELSERSASMTRQGIVSFVDSSIIEELNERISLGINIEETVLSKYMAYRGLMFSSCHCIENYVPKIIIIPDGYRIIKNQHIKYVVDEKIPYTDKETGEEREWVQKGITDGFHDIKINMFDGCGIHHPSITNEIGMRLGGNTHPTSMQWRLPFIKGVTHEIDYTTFCEEHGVEYIVDCWGQKHSIYEPMVIMTESMYKGLGFFKNTGSINDWYRYWERFYKYEHCIGIAKCNFTKEEEPIYTRVNYQILQDLNLTYDQFRTLAQDSVYWVESIVYDNIFYTYCFLGMFYENHKPMNGYVKAVMKNPEMLKEKCVNDYVKSLLKKYIDEMKCGKLWLKATFKIWTPDLYAFMEHMCGLSVDGCLSSTEFWSNNKDGEYIGEFAIERNPHICKSEHTILTGVSNSKTQKYFNHLSNVCMCNVKSITMSRLAGSDYDGDIVLLIDNETFKSGIERDCPIVIDIEDKITALKEPVNKEHIIKLLFRNLDCAIGEISNCATSYHNKTPRTDEQKKVYEDFISLLSVGNGKEIDKSKTGVSYKIPRYIAKWAKPLPYFMKYASPYYATMSKFNKAWSNMNRLCFDIEKWEKELKYRRYDRRFDYTIMIAPGIPMDEEKYKKIDCIYQEFCKEMEDVKKLAYMCLHYSNYKQYFNETYPGHSKEMFMNWEPNWNYYYDKYKKLCREICPDKQELANIVVSICYVKYPSRSKKFIWKVAEEGILTNILCKKIELPKEDMYGMYVYLGRAYNMEEVYNRDK